MLFPSPRSLQVVGQADDVEVVVVTPELDEVVVVLVKVLPVLVVVLVQVLIVVE